MLQEYSRTIETNNRQLEVQRAHAQLRNAQMRLVLDRVAVSERRQRRAWRCAAS